MVTGASRGLGLAMTERLLADGWRVLALARSEGEGLSALAARHGGEALRYLACDLSDVDALPALVRRARAETGPIWGLVNNAGLGTEGPLATMGQPAIEALLRLNTLSPIMLTRAVSRGMAAQGGGRIVNISSIVASRGFAGLSVYSATKAALLGFTRSLARELGPAGVTVNAVAPGFVATDMTGHMAADALERVRRRSPMKRLSEAQDIAASVAFLLSDDARNITGQVITVDAGATV